MVKQIINKKCIIATRRCLKMWEWIRANRKYDTMISGDLLKGAFLEIYHPTMLNRIPANCFLCGTFVCHSQNDRLCPLIVKSGSKIFGDCEDTPKGCDYHDWRENPYKSKRFEDWLIRRVRNWLKKHDPKWGTY